MDLSHIKHQFLELAAHTATKHPVAWIYSFMAAGMAIGISTTGFMGWLIGNPFGYGQLGQIAGFGVYGFFFISNMEIMKLLMDRQVEQLRQAREMLER